MFYGQNSCLNPRITNLKVLKFRQVSILTGRNEAFSERNPLSLIKNTLRLDPNKQLTAQSEVVGRVLWTKLMLESQNCQLKVLKFRQVSILTGRNEVFSKRNPLSLIKNTLRIDPNKQLTSNQKLFVVFYGQNSCLNPRFAN